MATWLWVIAGTVLGSVPGEPLVDKIIILGLDGVSATGLSNAQTPHMDKLFARGVSTDDLRVVMPSASLPNWASFLMGAGPEQHGVTSNGWRSESAALRPTAKGPGGFFPSIYSVIKQRHPQWRTVALLDWQPIERLIEPCCVDQLILPKHGKKTSEDRLRRAEELILEAAGVIERDGFNFMFIHLDHPDHFGHRDGWESKGYLASIEHADRLVGELVEALAKAEMTEKTALIVVSDHGGVGTSHGGATDAEILVPWVMVGPGIRSGGDLGPLTSVYDTAATAAYLAGAARPACWVGQPLLGAFDGTQLPRVAGRVSQGVKIEVGEQTSATLSWKGGASEVADIRIDWGNGVEDWRLNVQADKEIQITHSYAVAGNYRVRAQVVDANRISSDWVALGGVRVGLSAGFPKHLVGLWEFSREDNKLASTLGKDLQVAGNAPVWRKNWDASASTGPGMIETQAGKGSYLLVEHGIGPNGGGRFANDYTLLYDLWLPSPVQWHALLKTDVANKGDADLFVRPNKHGNSAEVDSLGRGGLGYSRGSLPRDRWIRLVLTFDLANESVKAYLDGELFETYSWQAGTDSRFALRPQGLLIGADDDGENQALGLAQVGVFQRALNAQQIAALGTVETKIKK